MNSSNSLSAPVSQETSEHSDKMNCELCVAEFDSDAELKKHKELHKRPSDKSLNCLDCGISFENQKSRSDHIYTLHPGYLPAECDICGRRFKNGTVLKGHKNTHLGKTNFQCETCGFKFLTKGNYERHLKTHERGKLGKEQKCLYCEELFEELELLRVHVLSLHKDQLIETPDTRYLTNTAKISFKCTTCEYIGNSLPQTIKHFEMHTGERESEHLCKYCNAGLPTVDKKRAHEKKHLDSKGNVHFNCHECPATFETAEAFVEHYNTHYDQLAHRCRYCARMFTRLAALARHMEQYHQDQQPTDSNDGLTVTERIHIDCYGYKSQLVPGPERNKFGNLAFLCKICGRKFFGFDGLAKHYRDHETNGKFNCPICEMGYPYNFELHKHLVKHHDNKSMKSYECCLCQESIEGALNFKKHCTDHSQFDKEKCTYICLECDSEFTTYLKMSQHLKTHKDGDEVAVKSEQNTDEPDVTLMEVESSGTKNEVKCEELPYACKFCSKRFVHAGFLAKHVYEFHADLISNASNDGLTLKERIYLDCFEVLAQITPGPERNDAGEVGLSCKYCGKVLFGYTAIVIHQRVHEKNAEFKCEICDKQFRMKSNYKLHMAVHEKTKVEQQQNCLYCTETFSDIFGLRQHIWSSHAEVLVKLPCTSSKFYKCKTCSYLGSSLPDIIKHAKLHTGDGLIQHECKHCKVGFTTKQETKLHEAKHLDSDGNVHFDCQSCPEKLKTAEAFAKHFQMHYDQMPFSCQYCPRKFELAGVWARHVEHYHKDMIPTDRNDGLTISERIHVDCYNFNLVPGPERDSTGRLAILCRICEVKCYGFINILKHSRQHESAEKFLCPICDQKSSYEYELRTHLEKHDKKSEKKMYECALCKEKVKGAKHFHQHCISHKEFDKSDGSYNCSRCGFTSPSFVKFGNHLNEVGDCKITSEVDNNEVRENNPATTFRETGRIHSHLEGETSTVHNDDLPYVCRYCNRRFDQQGFLGRHLLKKHSNLLSNPKNGLTIKESVSLECFGVPVKIKNKSNRNKQGHLTFICTYCDNEYDGVDAIIRHYKRHVDEGKFSCPLCEAKFPCVGNLNAHLLIHDKKKTTYQCTLCRTKMKGAVNFNKHCLAHPEYNATENTFKCSKCNWKQNSYQELVKHLKNHTDNMMNVDEDMTAADNPTIIDDDNIVNQGQSILAESEFGVAGSFDDVDIDEMMDMNNTNHEIMQHEFAALPLSVAVYKSAVSNPDSSFIIWCKKLDADLIDVARLYPDRISICVTGTKKQNPKSSQNTLVSTQIYIGDGNEKDFKVKLYSTTPYEERRHFSSIGDFQEALLLHLKFHKMEHYVRQSFKDLQILKRLDGIKLIICNCVGDTQQL